MFVEAERIGLEGVVGKRAASPYVSKRSRIGSRSTRRSPTTSSSSATCPPKGGASRIRRAAAGAISRQRSSPTRAASAPASTSRELKAIDAVARRSRRARSRRPPRPTSAAAVWIAPGLVVQVQVQAADAGRLVAPADLHAAARRTSRRHECVWPASRRRSASTKRCRTPPAATADDAAEHAHRRSHEPRQGVLAARTATPRAT